MKKRFAVGGILWLTLSVAGAVRGGPAAGGEPGARHHHDLRGVITKVEAEKNQFEIQTDAGHVVLCLIDNKTTLRRGEKEITLKDVRPGERARCHCAALQGGRHYSASLLVEPEKKKKAQKKK